MFLLTGSAALNFHLYQPCNPKSDIDFIASESDLNKIGLSFDGKDSLMAFDNVEFINRELLNNDKFIGGLEYLPFSYKDEFKFGYSVATIEELYIQKRSHLFRPIKFARHIQEFQKIKEYMREPLNEEQNQILKQRIKLTKEKYGDRTPSLRKTNDDFFNDKVKRYYVHDDIHRAVAYYDEPIYERLKHDPELAKCEKDLWLQLSHSDRVKCVQEECFVIALERYIIPSLIEGKRHMPEKFSFYNALEKVCTTLCSGFFRDFAIDNWKEICQYEVDFLKKFSSSEIPVLIGTPYAHTQKRSNKSV